MRLRKTKPTAADAQHQDDSLNSTDTVLRNVRRHSPCQDVRTFLFSGVVLAFRSPARLTPNTPDITRGVNWSIKSIFIFRISLFDNLFCHDIKKEMLFIHVLISVARRAHLLMPGLRVSDGHPMARDHHRTASNASKMAYSATQTAAPPIPVPIHMLETPTCFPVRLSS